MDPKFLTFSQPPLLPDAEAGNALQRPDIPAKTAKGLEKGL